MYCELESIATKLILTMEKSFGVHSEPVAILLALLIAVGSLYGLLVPALCVSNQTTVLMLSCNSSL